MVVLLVVVAVVRCRCWHGGSSLVRRWKRCCVGGAVDGEVYDWHRSLFFFISRNVVSFFSDAIVVLTRCSSCSCRFQVKVAHPWLMMIVPLQMR